jgi:hypothetical protein
MPRRKLSFEWRNGKLRPRMMTDQEAFEDDRKHDGETAALNRWFERQQPVWLLIGEGNKG